MKVFPDGTLGQLYFGKAVRDREGFDHLLEMKSRPMSAIAGISLSSPPARRQKTTPVTTAVTSMATRALRKDTRPPAASSTMRPRLS